MADVITKKLSALDQKSTVQKTDEVVLIDRDGTVSTKRVTVDKILKKALAQSIAAAV